MLPLETLSFVTLFLGGAVACPLPLCSVNDQLVKSYFQIRYDCIFTPRKDFHDSPTHIYKPKSGTPTLDIYEHFLKIFIFYGKLLKQTHSQGLHNPLKCATGLSVREQTFMAVAWRQSKSFL